MILKKLSTKPIWYWERYRPYPILKSWRNLPVLDDTTSDGLVVAVLTTPATTDMAAWSAYSWRLNLGVPANIQIYVDGDAPPAFQHSLSDVLPGIEVRSLPMPNEDLKKIFPSLYQFGRSHPLGRKLLLILGLQEETSLIYSDSDVLLFQRPDRLLDCVSNQSCAFNQEHIASCYDSQILDNASQLGIQPSECLNTGLLCIVKDRLSGETAENLLADVPDHFSTWFTEQTILACLMNQVSAIPLPKESYIVSPQRQFWWEKDIDYSSAVTRHYTGTVRHLLCLHGHPIIRKQARGLNVI